MNTEILITLVILLCAVVFYSTTWMNMTATSLLILAALYLSGIVSVSELFVNLVNSSTLLVIFMFIIIRLRLYKLLNLQSMSAHTEARRHIHSIQYLHP